MLGSPFAQVEKIKEKNISSKTLGVWGDGRKTVDSCKIYNKTLLIIKQY